MKNERERKSRRKGMEECIWVERKEVKGKEKEIKRKKEKEIRGRNGENG